MAQGPESCRTKRTPAVVALQVGIVLLLAAAVFCLPVAFDFPAVVLSDVALVDDKLVVTTNIPHHLVYWAMEVEFE